jgi:hypothetical protein
MIYLRPHQLVSRGDTATLIIRRKHNSPHVTVRLNKEHHTKRFPQNLADEISVLDKGGVFLFPSANGYTTLVRALISANGNLVPLVPCYRSQTRGPLQPPPSSKAGPAIGDVQ